MKKSAQTVLAAFCISLFLFQPNLTAQTIIENSTATVFHFGPEGKLVYAKDAQGNRLPDFSTVGYHSGEKAIPDIPAKITIEPIEGDNTEHIQDALDQLGTLPADENGFRGALLLKRGEYRVDGRLIISSSGTVLRGKGPGPDGTVIIATGYDKGKYKRPLITVAPKTNPSVESTEYASSQDVPKMVLIDSKSTITDKTVPIGARSISIESAADFKPGDRIAVYRPSTAEWIHSIGCDRLTPNWTKAVNVLWIKTGDQPGVYFETPDWWGPEHKLLKKENESWDEFVKRVPFSEDESAFDSVRQWQPGEYDFYFERKITAIDGNRITIDAPIVHAMEQPYGGGAIYKINTPDRVTEVGIENLRLISEFATPAPGHPYGNPERETKSEQHAWHGIQLTHNTENTWVRNVTGKYFGWSLVSASGKHATVQDCLNLGHASKITGGRRYSFMINGQLNLVQRCVTFNGRHEFVNQAQTLGPNVFVDCIGFQSKSAAGPHNRYAVGNLYDNVKTEAWMESYFRDNSGTGHGWAGTQTVFYNCSTPFIKLGTPPGGISWSLGSGRPAPAPPDARYSGENPGEVKWIAGVTGTGAKRLRMAPPSLYYQQVKDRLGQAALNRIATEEQQKHLGEYRWVKARLKGETVTE